MRALRPTSRPCPACGADNRVPDGFCPNCGAPLPEYQVPDPVLHGGYFEVPSYLQSDAARRRRRMVRSEGAGGGLVSVGLLVGALSFISTFDPTLARAALLGGILVVIAGYWRMRRDPDALGRVGLVTGAGAVAALALVSFQGVDPTELAPFGAGRSEDERAALTPTPDWRETPTGEAAPVAGPALADVPMFRGNPARTGEEAGPGPAANPKLLWKHDTRGEVYSSPAVVGGTVFVGSKSGFLYALDGRTGETRWRFDVGEGYIIRASPAVVNGVVYVASGFRLWAVDAAAGTARWSHETGFAGPSSPVVVDGTVYVSSQEGMVHAVDAASGTARWAYDAEGLVFSSPAVSGGSVYFGSDNGDLYALDAASGRVRWRFPTDGEVYATPAVVGDTVYVSSRSQVSWAVDTATGRPRWSFPAGGEASPAVVGGVVFLGSDSTGLYAVDAASGEERWLFPTGAPVKSSPTVAGGIVFVGSGSSLYAVDAAAGTERWRYPTTEPIESSPAVAGGVAFVGSRDGFLYAIEGQAEVGTPGA